MKTPMNFCVPLISLLVLAAVVVQNAHGQTMQSSRIGYVYPAGGQQDTTFEVAVGGKGLQKIESIQISGSGVQASFVQHISNYKRKYQEQLRVIKQQNSGNTRQLEKSKERKYGPAPEHEMFTRLEDLSSREFRQVASKFQTKEKVQRNRELDELVILQITIEADARPGMRELRLLSRAGGASNPIRFMVNTLPEAREYEPNDLKTPEQSHLQPPFIMNGQIMPGDEDRFSFDAIEGQQIVIRVQARELVPYLADAVPGWFQAVVAIHDDKGNEVAYADDFLFNPDPALLFKVPQSGRFHVSIRDSIYRGREDFVYRIAVGEIPFVTGIFPLGAQLGTQARVTAYGWNLDAPGFALNTTDRGGSVRTGFLHSGGMASNNVHYAIEQLPESVESNANDSLDEAQAVELKSTVNGRIDEAGDVDFYRFHADKGQTVKISINARRLYSPVDSLLRIFDSNGEVLAWNDDMPPAGNLTDRTGLLTHNSDSELEFKAPQAGTFFVQVSDAQGKGGPTYAYRFSVTEPRPGFDLYITPSVISIPGGSGGEARLHVKRKHGYNGPIDVKLANQSKGLELSGGRIPANSEGVPVVISGQRRMAAGLLRLDLVARAEIDGETVSQRVIPADDITQAFITHHLVEADDLSAYVLRNFRKPPSIQTESADSIVLSANKVARLNLRMSDLPAKASEPIFRLESAPEGVSMETRTDADRTSLEFTVDESLESGQQGNLVVGVYFEVTPKSKEGRRKTRTLPLGVLPAISYRAQ